MKKKKRRSNKSKKKTKRSLNKTTPQKLQPQPSPKKGILQMVSNTWKTVGVLSILLTLASSFFLFYPRLSLQIGKTIEPKNPFHTKFIVENIGYFSIKNIHFVCGFNEAIRLNGNPLMSNLSIDLASKNIKNLKPNTKSKIAIDKIFSRNFRFSKADIVINIEYGYSFLKRKMSQRFVTDIDNFGNLVWVPSSLNN